MVKTLHDLENRPGGSARGSPAMLVPPQRQYRCNHGIIAGNIAREHCTNSFTLTLALKFGKPLQTMYHMLIPFCIYIYIYIYIRRPRLRKGEREKEKDFLTQQQLLLFSDTTTTTHSVPQCHCVFLSGRCVFLRQFVG